jgi:hypothetical protein
MKEKEDKLRKTLLYIGNEGAVTLDVIIDKENETMWITQKTMAQTFGVNVRTISEHLQNIFKAKELDESSVFWKIQI